ncbi:MAG: 2-oxo acid dehydrogenase subunit E2 [Victivallaceae bacterium]|nr:2-oxo acid dehydrogenase subunit E2 [Victivallaceae bacterium]
MATKIPIPKLGQSEETVTIESWKVKEGDVIKKGDVLFEIETDKAVLEVESQFEGTLLKIIIQAGKEVPVMSIAAVIGEPGEDIPEIEQPVVAAPTAAPKKSAPVPAAKPAKAAAPQPVAQAAAPVVAAAPIEVRKPNPSPRAKKYAADFLLDLDKIIGTGGEVGRVTEQDVKNYLETSGYFDKKITPAAFNVAQAAELELLAIDGSGDSGRITLADVRAAVSEKPQKMSTMRKIIAQRLCESKQQIPHFYVTVSIDMTELMAKRAELKADGIKLSVNTFIVKAVALALKAYPEVNSTTDGNSIIKKSKINIGIAVSIDAGLVVPVLNNSDKMQLDELQDVAAELAGKARSGKLLPEAMQGGTFTISNMGMLNVENFSAIINPGESAILAVSSTVKTPVVIDDEIVIRNIMKVTLSCDHRTVDGATAAMFANAVKTNLEDRELWDSMI